MAEWFSTDLVPGPDRLDAWRSQAIQICGNSKFQFPRQRIFQGAIDRRVIGVMQVTQFSSTPVSFAKYPMVNANAGDRGCIIISQLKGIREYCQAGNSVILEPGDTTLIDAGRPWSSTCASHCSRLYLRLPRWLVQEKLQVSNLPLAQRIAGGSGLGATLFHLGSSLYREAGQLSMNEGVAAVEAYLHILSACIGGRERFAMPAPDLDSRIAAYIDGHVADPGLSPASIATAVGISVRHLHRVFSSNGLTVTAWIRDKRLQNCRLELASPGSLERNITDIAFSWGFSDSAHFSHCFKKQFGMSPREFRSNFCGESVRGDRLRGLHSSVKPRLARLN